MTNSDRTGKKIAECGFPVVVMDRKLSEGREIAFIESDHYKGGKLAWIQRAWEEDWRECEVFGMPTTRSLGFTLTCEF